MLFRSHSYGTDRTGVATRCSTEVIVTDSREKDLEELGFMADMICAGCPAEGATPALGAVVRNLAVLNVRRRYAVSRRIGMSLWPNQTLGSRHRTAGNDPIYVVH